MGRKQWQWTRYWQHFMLLCLGLFMSAVAEGAHEKIVRSPNPKCARIVSLSPAMSAILVDLGLAENIVGATPYCRVSGVVMGARAKTSPTHLRRITDVGGFFNLNFEQVVSLKPSLVLMQGQKNIPLIGQFSRFNIEALALPLDNLAMMAAAEAELEALCFERGAHTSKALPKTSNTFAESLSDLAAMARLNMEAQKKREEEKREERVEERAGGEGEAEIPKILLLYSYREEAIMDAKRASKAPITFPVMAAGRSFHGELLTAIGASNRYEGALNAPELTEEAIFRLDPDWIILLNGADALEDAGESGEKSSEKSSDNLMGGATLSDLSLVEQSALQAFLVRERVEITPLTSWQEWGILSELSAVKEGRVYEIRGYPTQIPTKTFTEILAKALIKTLYQ